MQGSLPPDFAEPGRYRDFDPAGTTAPLRDEHRAGTQFNRVFLERLLGNIHHKVISTFQELLVPGLVASLALWFRVFFLFLPSPYVLDTEDLQISCSRRDCCHAPQ